VPVRGPDGRIGGIVLVGDLAAALTGRAGVGPIVAIVSGGNIDLAKFCELIGACKP